MPHVTPDLEERFLQPAGWVWGNFTREGREIRFGSIYPQDCKPTATIVCFPGLSEFAEKYFETARWALERGYGFAVIDWFGQGLSDRYLDNPHKRHSTGFQKDIDDAHHFITNYVSKDAPLVLLAHSMGGHLGFHYLHQHPEIFSCAGFTAPMINIKAFKAFPFSSHLLITGNMPQESYVWGGHDWREDMRPAADKSRLSKDPARNAIHNIWCQANPALQNGSVTWGWLNQAALSCQKLQKDETLNSIHTHFIATAAGDDDLVDNAAIKKMSRHKYCTYFREYTQSGHEILMERDEIRGDFLGHFDTLIKETAVHSPQSLKPIV